jgi:hypothetical protein
LFYTAERHTPMVQSRRNTVRQILIKRYGGRERGFVCHLMGAIDSSGQGSKTIVNNTLRERNDLGIWMSCQDHVQKDLRLGQGEGVYTKILGTIPAREKILAQDVGAAKASVRNPTGWDVIIRSMIQTADDQSNQLTLGWEETNSRYMY